MRWSLLIAVCGLSITDVASFAQRPPADQRLNVTRSSSQDAGFFASTGVVRFQLIQGRLCLDAPRHRKGSQNRDEDGVYESITVTAQRGIPSLHYVCQTPDHHLTLSVQQAEAVRIESWFPQFSERSVLEQPARGTITWTHSRGDLNEEYRGQTLLHLRQRDISGFDLHFGFLIERLLRGNSIRAISESTQLVLIEQVATTAELAASQQEIAGPNEAMIRECIDQLRSGRRATRIVAERKLLAWGTPIIPVVQRCSADRLDSEQSERLRQIMRRLRPHVSDTPATLARLLINDRSYWDAIANSLGSEQQKLANAHLTQFGVDPIAIAAEPDERIASGR